MIKRTVTIDMHMEFGSVFQEEHGERVLLIMIQALQQHLLTTHKKNKMSYSIKNISDTKKRPARNRSLSVE